MAFHQSDDDPRVRVTLELRQSTLQWIDGLSEEMCNAQVEHFNADGMQLYRHELLTTGALLLN